MTTPEPTHAQGCDESIDRGLGFLCGDQPGRPSEFGCGRWFCGQHLFSAPEPVDGLGICGPCLDAWEAEHGVSGSDEEGSGGGE